MSEATSQTTAACEQLLDYVYEMLDAPQKAAFEQHLATCARCQAEAASFGKVRNATAKLMPAVEPTANLTGALHAQLMHAAAQRKPSRGKLLAFPRRIMQHPAWAAAAMFVIVGSAITINVMRDKFAMPTTSATASAPVSVAEPEKQPLPEPVAAAAKQDRLDGVADSYGNAAVGGKGAEMKVSRPRHSPAPMKTAKAEDASGALGGLGSTASSGGGGGLTAKPAAHAAKKAAPARDVADDDLFAGADKAAGPRAKNAKDTSATTGVARLSKEEERSLNQPPPAPRQQTQTKVTSELMRNTPSGGRAYDEPVPSASPPETAAVAPAPAEVAASPPSRFKSSAGYDLSDSVTSRKSLQQPAASPMASAPPPPAARAVAPPQVVTAPAVAQQQSQTRGGYEGSSLPAPKAAAPQRETEDLHARADELVRANRCDDAVKVYAELDRRAQRMSPKERASYVRCLTATGRQQAAEQQLDELKADKSVTNGLVRQAETDVQSGRRVGEKAKAAKKSDADRAKPTQQQAQPYDATPAAATKR